MFNIQDYIDVELAMLIAIALFSFILLNKLFKKVSMPVVLKRFIIVFVICGIGFMTYTYIEKEEVVYLESLSNNYIIGKVQFVGKSVDKINVKFVNSNIPVKSKKEITVKVNPNTRYLAKQGYSPAVEVSIDELKLGDVVTIYCKENSLLEGNKEITARKIIKKES